MSWRLTERGARLLRTCRTASGYRQYPLEGSLPARPALLRDETVHGPGIEVEIWAVPEHQFGGLVAALAAPLSVGCVTLEDGETVKGLLCEPSLARKGPRLTSTNCPGAA